MIDLLYTKIIGSNSTISLKILDFPNVKFLHFQKL